MNMFEQAVRQQLRFDFKGQISIEQLYAMRRTQTLKDELITYEEQLTEQAASFGKTTRRQSVDKSLAQKQVELRLAIISSLLDEIEQQEKESAEKSDKQAKRQELLALKAQKQAEQLKGLSLEEIDAQLAAL
jgi:hypothetical protein